MGRSRDVQGDERFLKDICMYACDVGIMYIYIHTTNLLTYVCMHRVWAVTCWTRT